MPKSYKLKEGNYIDSKSVVYKKKKLDEVLYTKPTIIKGTLSGNNGTAEIKLTDYVSGNTTIIIDVAGIHNQGSDNYSYSKYLVRMYGTINNSLTRLEKKQSGSINIDIIYRPSDYTLVLTNSGSYGTQYTVVLA